MPGRPSKPVKVIEIESKSHRTKKELAHRRKAETSTLSGKKLIESREVKEDLEAHREFLRISKLLDAVEKNDALYSEVINRYCLLKSECKSFADKRERTGKQMELLEERMDEMELPEYLKLQNDLSKALVSYDRQIQIKRKMMFDIEKENIMTIAAALRSVPKQPEKKSNPLMEALNG